MKWNVISIFIALFLISCGKQSADLIVMNACIYTVNNKFDTASVLVIQDGKFLEVGNKDLLKKYKSEKTIDAKGEFIYPGFIDAHCHFTGYAMDRYKLELMGSTSFDEVISKVIEYSKTNNHSWIEGRSWDQNLWKAKAFPTKDTLDKLFPNTPVLLMRVDGHVILCNQKALEIAGIKKDTEIPGGKIEVKNGKLTGILYDAAIDYVKKNIPTVSDDNAMEGLIQTENECFQNGLTTVVDCWVKSHDVAILKNAYQTNKLKIRTSCFLSDEPQNLENYLSKEPFKDDKLHIAGFKFFADGSLGSRGAFLIQAYSDKEHEGGSMSKPEDSLRQFISKIYNSKYQLATHAIGDGANREILKLYSEVLSKDNDRRWRIEHAQVVDSSDFKTYNTFNIIPSVQPTHAMSDMSWAINRLGTQRIKFAYAYQTLLQQNNWLPLGTDFPVENMNPLNTFCAAVFRQNKDGMPAEGFQIENALTREQALRGITIWAAKSTFEEDSRGSIEKGKFADFLILPIDLMKASATVIYSTKVKATYIAGLKVY